MSSATSFKIYDPVAQLVASGGGSGGLPLTGGSLSGNLTMTFPAKIQQNQEPSVGNDLVNKTYTDGAYQAKKPSAVANNVALFGSGTDAGQTIDSGFSVDSVLANPPANTTLWPSSRIIGSLQYGAGVYKSTAALTIGAGVSVRAFSSGNANVGPTIWISIGSTYSLDVSGIATISNSLQYTTFFRLIFSANSLSESANNYGSLQCQFQNEPGLTPFGVLKTLKVFPPPPSAFCTEVYLTALVGIAPFSAFQFSVLLTNPGGINSVTIDPTSPDDPSLLVIERIS
jgi:hypothetical protein